MNKKEQTNTARFRKILLGTVVAAGVAGFSASQSGLFSVAPSYAEAVKVQTAATFNFADVVEAVSPAVVSVRVQADIHPASDRGEFRRDFRRNFGFDRPGRGFRDYDKGPRKRKGFSQGSGFFISDDGYIVTNNHVIENGSDFTIVMADGEEHEAKLIGSDPRTDLAVLKVDTDTKFEYVDFGDALPRIGEWVVAVGNPFGLGGTVTAGIVSGHSRNIGAGQYDDFIQIDAAVNRGNSGGPAFNLNGEVIGVNTAIFSPSGGNVGIAFSIPAATATEVVDELIENGSVVRGWLGVQIQRVTSDIAESLGLEEARGAIVSDPQDGSPADEAGIKSGDIITSVNGQNVKGPRQLSRVIAGFDPQTEVKIGIIREGKNDEVSVKLGELESTKIAANERNSRQMGRLGLQLQATDDGVLVLDVRPGSRAEARGIRAGDIIRSVSGKDVTSVEDIRKELRSVRESGRKSALLQIDRQGNTTFVPVPLRRG